MLKKLKEIEYPLLNRKRISYEAEHSEKSTPSKKELKEEISKKLNVDSNLIAIRHVFTSFGMQKSKVIVHVYNDEKTLKLLEPPKGKKTEKKEAAK